MGNTTILKDRVGEINTNTQGLKMWIKDYKKSNDIIVEFENGYISYNRNYCEFKKGQIRNKNFKIPQPKGIGLIDRTGEINYNHYGSKMTITKYTNANDIIVEFENGYTTRCIYGDFKKRKIVNPYDKMVYNVGYIGDGEFKASVNNIEVKEYRIWHGIVQRCYNASKQKKKPSYIGCSICDEWLNYQNFAEWYNKNYYQIENCKMEVDKDILHKGNKVYSPENCVLVPYFINCLFVKHKSTRGDYPIGVSICNNRLRARMKKLVDGKCKEFHLGYFDTPVQAFNAYKQEKEKHIKEVANQYKDKIPERLYIAMMNYIVEITD